MTNVEVKVAEVISVGSELLLGDILNSNGQYLAQELAKLGIAHYYQTTVGDNPERLQQAIELAASRANLLIFTGGLGPTPDDLTTETIANTFQTALVERAEVWNDIQAKFAQRGRTLTDNNRKQALLPEGADILKNPVGTAPGMIWSPQPHLLILTFPGVPSEMKRMWQDIAVPLLKAQGWSADVIASRILRFWGVSESALAEKVSHLFEQANPTVAPYSNWGEVKLRISAKAPTTDAAMALIAPMEAEIRDIAGIDCFGADAQSLGTAVGALLQQRQETLAVAESCTGGGLGSYLTEIPGSSQYFHGGVIAYDNSVKQSLLDVSAADLAQLGAVSEAVAKQMAQGVRDRLGTTWGLSITGVAGPDGGTPDKPVGCVYIGVAGPVNVMAKRYQFGARGRDWVRRVSVCSALDQLRRACITTPFHLD
ncbi:competence/damage-inducible protein A [filamentous cyanobacterium LEGE 11480]|uniref:CinA-like protein n=1 Tax=Romeriopsis navalis LEGE 11480 TaxID=2777977 RepID=A0A928VR08_9CYAN|nr:competence/damage-inducible protein A [Romeriopsis navalis]MBE9030952.1 competence/damage-inducible protein A [Romeriopsis navalis LEGE 11480]